MKFPKFVLFGFIVFLFGSVPAMVLANESIRVFVPPSRAYVENFRRSEAQFESKLPVGTKIFAYDIYVVTDGHSSQTFSVATSFRYRGNSLFAYDPFGPIVKFSSAATVMRGNNVGVFALLPGKHLTTEQIALVNLHGYRYIRTIEQASVKAPMINCDVLFPGEQRLCSGSGRGTW